jgi:hypothetical protein
MPAPKRKKAIKENVPSPFALFSILHVKIVQTVPIPHHEMIVRFAIVLEVSTDQILGLKPMKGNGYSPALKILRRMKKIEDLPSSQQKVLLTAIDNFLKGVEK